MMVFLRYIAAALENHFGAIVASAIGIYLIIAYARGELRSLFAFVKDMLTGPDGRASTKNAGYFMGASTLCWAFVKVTLATCRRIDSANSPLDPTTVFITLLGVIATLVGSTYLVGKALMKRGMNEQEKPTEGQS